MGVQEQFGEQVTIIGVPGFADSSEFDEFIESTGSGSIHHLVDEDATLATQFGVTNHRAYVFINDDGAATLGSYGDLGNDVARLVAQ